MQRSRWKMSNFAKIGQTLAEVKLLQSDFNLEIIPDKKLGTCGM